MLNQTKINKHFKMNTKNPVVVSPACQLIDEWKTGRMKEKKERRNGVGKK